VKLFTVECDLQDTYSDIVTALQFREHSWLALKVTNCNKIHIKGTPRKCIQLKKSVIIALHKVLFKG